ncbi:MAG: helix-turn-helix domain-containing protein [Clostridia bacterium]|nr:helix-turn-helix domain-containing protein [Clostridia bacterium]
MNIIRELRLKRGLSQFALAKICGVHQTAISQWEKGRTSPDAEMLSLLSDYFNVSVDLLLGKARGDEKNMVPVLGYVKAGIPIEAVEEVLGYEEITPHMASTGEHFALMIKGDSMLPRFCPGDVVIVRKQSDINNGEIAVVLVNGSDATVKKVFKRDNNLMLVSLNTAYEPIVYSSSDIIYSPVIIIGKVVELRAKFN